MHVIVEVSGTDGKKEGKYARNHIKILERRTLKERKKMHDNRCLKVYAKTDRKRLEEMIRWKGI